MNRCLAFSLFLCLSVSAQADLTLVQKLEGGGPIERMTIKIKGDKVRIDASPQVTTILDSKSGDMINLMNAQKMVMRVPGSQAKAMAQAGLSMTGAKPTGEKTQLKPTGKKETIDGHQTEEFVVETPQYTATYSIARNYPNLAEIMNQLRSTTPQGWAGGMTGMPDFRDFPGLPLRTKVKMGAQELTSSLVSVSLEAVNAAEFAVPADFKEMKVPDILGGLGQPGGASPSPKKP